jgi:hypothetical protein
MSKSRCGINSSDVLDLAVAALKLPENADYDEVDEVLARRFGIGFEESHKIVELLIQFTPVQTSPVTGTKYHTFEQNDGIYIFVGHKED